MLRFSITTAVGQDLEIPAGTVCMTAQGVRFQDHQGAVLAAGELTADAAAEAMESGAAGNVSPGDRGC